MKQKIKKHGRNTIALGAFLVGILGILMVSGFAAANGSTGFTRSVSNDDRAVMEQDRIALDAALVNRDYAAWKGVMDKKISKLQLSVNQETFNNMVNRHQQITEFHTALIDAKKTGDYTKVEALQKQYGLNQGKLMMRMHH